MRLKLGKLKLKRMPMLSLKRAKELKRSERGDLANAQSNDQQARIYKREKGRERHNLTGMDPNMDSDNGGMELSLMRATTLEGARIARKFMRGEYYRIQSFIIRLKAHRVLYL